LQFHSVEFGEVCFVYRKQLKVCKFCQ